MLRFCRHGGLRAALLLRFCRPRARAFATQLQTGMHLDVLLVLRLPAGTGGGLFGAPNSTPTFGAAPTTGFGAAPAGTSLFGGTPVSTPAFGAAGTTGGGLFGGGGGLFGGTSAFGATPQPAAGALVPAQPVQVSSALPQGLHSPSAALRTLHALRGRSLGGPLLLVCIPNHTC